MSDATLAMSCSVSATMRNVLLDDTQTELHTNAFYII